MIKNIGEKLIRFFNHIFVAIPFMMSFFLSAIYIFGGWEKVIEGHSTDYYFLRKVNITACLILMILLWIIVLLVITHVIKKLSEKIMIEWKRVLFIAVFVGFIALFIRYIFLLTYQEELVPFSDFNAAWERARGNIDGGSINYYSLFPAYLNWSVLENLIIHVFGEKYIYVLYFNAFCSGATASLIYLVSKEIGLDHWCCILAGLLYSLYPSNVIYTAIGTPEFLAICFNTLGILFLLKTVNSLKMSSRVLFSLSGGILLGIGGSYKTYSLVMIIAFVMVLVAHYCLVEQEKGRKKVCLLLLIFMVTVTSYRVTTKTIIDKSSDYFGIELDSKTAIPHFLLVGLNTEAEGQIHLGTLSRKYNQYYLANGMNYEEAKDYAYGLLKEDWKNNKKNIIPNLGKKMIWAWQDDCIPVSYFLNNVGVSPKTTIENLIYESINNYGSGFTEIIYSLVLLFAIIGAFSLARKKEINFEFELLALVIFGYFCMILLAEGQSRYKCLVMGYICIVSSVGIGVAKNIIAHTYRWHGGRQ